MNNLQKIASDISGYDAEENGARDDGYYNCKTVKEKIDYIIESSISADNVKVVNIAQAEAIQQFLDHEFSRENDRFWAFQALE